VVFGSSPATPSPLEKVFFSSETFRARAFSGAVLDVCFQPIFCGD
jgi:hypothetical protein